MRTTVSTKGQVVIPGPLRRRLGIRAGDCLEASTAGGRIVLTPRTEPTRPVRIVSDPLTGLPMLSAGKNAPVLSSRQVREALADFP